jgi:NAD(P)-dependent dehydrogenase (short-subunit alcohol dehydrogenase family)
VSSARRIVALTGVTRGLGHAMLVELAKAGHVVAACGRNAAQIQSLQLEYPAHQFAAVDVSDDVQVGHWADQVLKGVGTPDLLINNAALMNIPAPLWHIPAEEFGALMNVNVIGVANVIRHFVPVMIQARRGVIVNFSSGWGRSTSAGVAGYCASKWAIEGLTKSLAQDLPTGFAAIPLSPGIIDTDMLRTAFGGDAGLHESAARWATRAVPQILRLGPKDSGKSMSIE